MKTKKRSVRHQKKQEPINPEPIEIPPEVVVEPKKPEELLRRWIYLRCELDSGKELQDSTWHSPEEKGDKTFMEETNINEILKRVGSTIVGTIMSVAYGGDFQNPYEVLDAVEHDGAIFDHLTDYFEKNQPQNWNLAFSELIAACDDRYMCIERCTWRVDRNKARANFKTFVEGQVSSTLHSDRLYTFFFRLFFGYGTAASFMLESLGDLNDNEVSELMKGLIEKGRQGVFPWDFEKYITQHNS
jgi:hypothetical protein